MQSIDELRAALRRQKMLELRGRFARRDNDCHDPDTGEFCGDGGGSGGSSGGGGGSPDIVVLTNPRLVVSEARGVAFEMAVFGSHSVLLLLWCAAQ